MTGIDYGMGTTNIDNDTSIRYGVIHQNEVLKAWCDSSESDYGPPSCGGCGNEAVQSIEFGGDEPDWYDSSCDFHCPECESSFHSEAAYGDEALSHYINNEEYTATQGGDDCDIFIVSSPYYTKCEFCGPCAPGAGYIMNHQEDGVKTYCFGHDWFEGGVAPYPVYSVTTHEEVKP